MGAFKGGIFTVASGVSGTQSVFTFPHGLGVLPDGISVTSANQDAIYNVRATGKELVYDCSADATDITVTYSLGGCPASTTLPAWNWIVIQN